MKPKLGSMGKSKKSSTNISAAKQGGDTKESGETLAKEKIDTLAQKGQSSWHK